MSKSLGNVIAPQEVDEEARRRDHPPVGAPRPTTRATSRSTTRSWSAWSTPTAASATRCASCSPTPATSTRRRTRCRSPRCSRSTATRWRARRSSRPRCWRTTRSTSSTRSSPSCRCICSEDLGAFYLDILKDRLYTTAPKSLARRWRRPRSGTSRTRCCAGWRRSSASPPRRRGRCSRRASASIFVETYCDDRRARRRRCSRSGRASARSATLVEQGDRGAARSRQGRLVAAGQRGDHVPMPAGELCAAGERSATT